METISTREKIERLEKELTELREQERTEREEVYKKANEDRNKELQAIKDAIAAYNKKYGQSVCLAVKRDSRIGRDLWSFFPWTIE